MTRKQKKPIGDWLLHQHPRLLASLVLGIACGLLLPSLMPITTRMVLGFDVGALSFLAQALLMMIGATPQRMRRAASIQDEGLFTILALTMGGAAFSIAVIVLELNGSKGLPHQAQAFHVALAVISMIGTWIVVHTLFALHYAHTFYDERENPEPAEKAAAEAAGSTVVEGGLNIPGCVEPDYWDFLYFAFVLGMTCQTADVNITSREFRRLALGHGVLAFLFNTIILALAINVAASLL